LKWKWIYWMGEGVTLCMNNIPNARREGMAHGENLW
jgi:hypothetical protein